MAIDWDLFWFLEGFYLVAVLLILLLAVLVTLTTWRQKPHRLKKRRPRMGWRKIIIPRRWWFAFGCWIFFGLALFSWIVELYFCLAWIRYAWDWLIWQVGQLFQLLG